MDIYLAASRLDKYPPLGGYLCVIIDVFSYNNHFKSETFLARPKSLDATSFYNNNNNNNNNNNTETYFTSNLTIYINICQLISG